MSRDPTPSGRPWPTLQRADAERVLRRAIEIETKGGEWIDGEELRQIADAADVDPRSLALALEELEKERRAAGTAEPAPVARVPVAPPAPAAPVTLSLTVSSDSNACVSATVTVPAAAGATQIVSDTTRFRLDTCLVLALLSAVIGLVMAVAAWALGLAGIEARILWVLAPWLGWGGLSVFILTMSVYEPIVFGDRRSRR